MKKIIIRSVIMILITVLLFWYILKDNFTTSIKLLASSNIIFLLLGFLTFFIAFIVDTNVFKILIRRHKKDYETKKIYELSAMTRFFNGITPFALGGQPFQAYELTQNDVKLTDSLLILTEMYIVHVFTLTTLTITAFILRYIFHFVPNGFLWTLTLIGSVFNLTALAILTFIALKIGTAKKIGKLIIKFLSKLHIIKKEDEAIDSFYNKCNEYSNGYKDLIKNKKIIIKCVLLNLINLSCYFLIAFFAIKAIDNTFSLNPLHVLCLSVLSYISATFVPIPGGSVGAEYAYYNYFILIIPESVIVPSLILWRFISYYLPMIIGGIIFNIVDNRASRKCKEESK